MSGSPELSLSWSVRGEVAPRLVIPLVRLGEPAGSSPPAPGLDPWRKLVTDATDAALVVDPSGRLVAISQTCAALLGEYGVDQLLGQHVLEILDLVDFHAAATPSTQYAERIPPLLSLAGDTLARGLLRVRRSDREALTIDAVAAPLHDDAGVLIGAVAFLRSV